MINKGRLAILSKVWYIIITIEDKL